MVDFGNRLRQLRISKAITQAELADRIGVTKAMVSSYELGVRMPSYKVLIKISSFFHVTTDYLLGVSNAHGLSVGGLTDDQISTIAKLIEFLQGD